MTSHDEQPRGLAWIFFIAIAIGVVSGVVAWLFRVMIGLVHNFAFFGVVGGSYNANIHTPVSSWGWLVIFVPVIGGLLVVWLVKNFAPQAKGHGVPEVIDAIHYNRAEIPGRVSLIKALASALSIGTGGSLGREGPIVQIGAAFSSSMAHWLKLPPRQRVVLIGCGASAGIAATFNAPLAGLLFSIELILVSINSQTILPVALSTAVAAYIGRILIGPAPAFDIPALHSAGSGVGNFYELLAMVPFGMSMGLLALVFIHGIYRAEDWFDSLPVNDYVRHALGSLALGLLFYALLKLSGHYYVQGVGYAAISDILLGVVRDPWFLLLLVALKLLATCLTIGSGGSGGVFSPSLFLGAALGGAFGHGMHLLFPSLGLDPAAFSVVGMAAMVAATTSAPLTAAIITYEMTLDYQVILPVMIAVGVAYAVRRWLSPVDIYTLKLLRRGHIVPEGLSSDMTGSLKVENLMNRLTRIMDHDDPFSPFAGLTIASKEGTICGLVHPFDRSIEFDVRVSDLMTHQFIRLAPHESLLSAMRKMKQKNTDYAIVSCDAKPKPEDVMGVLTHTDISEMLERAAELHQGHSMN